jgi:hypothetical protein
MQEWFQPISFGRSVGGTLRTLKHRLQDFKEDRSYNSMSSASRDDEWIMGFAIPPFQRDHVWTVEQSIAFINSARRGLPLGTYTYNVTLNMPEALRSDDNGRKYYFADLWLIDGYQRLSSFQSFLQDGFPVEGCYWSQIDRGAQNIFLQHVHFPAYETSLTDETQLREIYDLLNFGGTAHKEEERALPRPA